ncbi:MobQ family relaxase [Paenibacillus crassostreae]|uniref:Nickase n=1 Tax=Paenibacillus crassostreae TaxID=1763538 RepID=A0A162MZT5_9BACL|nr:MobQ family relaxase [Paenibacillus crassostreae]AOZ94886.1 nickase [Paenibacillus crassostreae]OAB75569.1 nickase [Paenibacillus crassostreae]
MGYFYFSSQILNRSNHSAVAAAAYRSGESLHSERDGLTKNYGKRKVAPDCHILKPKIAPDWVLNRERLWNEVEKAEKQKNAQLAREIRLALPKELSNEDQKQLLIDFCKENFSDKGMVADLSIHRDKKDNPHAHIMLTMRPFNEDGSWGNKRKKINQEVNGVMKKVSIHLTDWNEKETLIQWRKDYADKINEKLKDRGIDDKVSHESYQKQGLDRLPNVRLERTAYQYEMQVKNTSLRNNVPYEPVTFYGKVNAEIRQLNSEIDALSKLKRQRIVSLAEYKEEKSITEKLAAIRSNHNLSESDKASLKMVAQRSKSYVDFIVARNVTDDIENGNWKKKIDNEKTRILAEKNLLHKAYKAYQIDQKQVLKYGFNPSNFTQQMKEKISSIKLHEQKLHEDVNKHQVLLEKSKHVLNLQSNFTHQEFSLLYESEVKYSTEDMYYAVQYFKDTGKVLPEKEIQNYSHSIENEILKKSPTIVEQTQNISKSIFILNRAIQKQTKDRLEALKGQNFDIAYESSRKLEQYALQKEKHEKDLVGNVQLLRASLQQHYSDQIEYITDVEVLLQLHDRQEKGLSTDKVDVDLEQIYEKYKKYNSDQSPVNMSDSSTPEQKVEYQYSQSIASGLFQALEQAQHANENKKHGKDPTEKRQRRRYRGQELDH